MNARVAPPPLPWSPEAEQSVLGAVLISPDALLALAECRLQAAHFFDVRHRDIWSAVEGIAATRQPIDVVTVFERLQSLGKAEACGGLAYLNGLAECVPSAANVARHADIVIGKATRRAIVEAAGRVYDMANEPGDEDAVLDRVLTLFGGIQRNRAASVPRALGDLVWARLDHWQSLADGEVAPGMPTGFDILDEALGGGLKPGRVVVLAARPSVGKTSLAQQIGLQVAKQGQPVLMLSQEMPAGDLVDRALANLARVALDRLGTGRLQAEDWTRVADGVEAATRLPFFVDDEPALTLMAIRAKARRVQQQHGLALLVVDYLQLCASAGAFDKRHHQIEQISRGLKTLAKELNCCVLVLSQLNRSSAEDEPDLHHLKESGAIEEDADVVLMLHPIGPAPEGGLLLLCKVSKNRQGRRGRCGLALDPRLQHWQSSAGNVERQRTSRCAT